MWLPISGLAMGSGTTKQRQATAHVRGSFDKRRLCVFFGGLSLFAKWFFFRIKALQVSDF